MKFSGTAKEYKEYMRTLKLEGGSRDFLKFGACKNCKYWKIIIGIQGRSNVFQFGVCKKTANKVYNEDDSFSMKSDEFTTWNTDYCGRIIVGEDFGCIHFKKT